MVLYILGFSGSEYCAGSTISELPGSRGWISFLSKETDLLYNGNSETGE